MPSHRRTLASIRSPLFAALLLATVLGATACGGQDPATGGGAAGGGGSGGTGGASSSSTGGNPSVILSCGDNLPFVISCVLVGSNYTACSDYFGNNDAQSVSAQCVAGGGMTQMTPCELEDRAGACVFFSDALPDRCYVEHIAPPSAASFWESTCPAVGGAWMPAE